MRSLTATGDSRLLLWLRVREFAVPPTMITTATARRAAGDWAGACAAARVDVDLDLRVAARAHGPAVAARIRDDLRHLAPDLLRWQLPRIAPDGLLRPGLTVPLAGYRPVWLVARTPPARAGGGQRISLALWDGPGPSIHPHPRPSRRFRFDQHRYLWDARRAGELRDHAAPGWESPPDGELLRRGLIDPGRLHPLVAQALVPGYRPTAAESSGPPSFRPVECRGARHRIGLVGGVLAALDHDPEEIRREEMLSALGGTPLACLRAIDDAHRHPADLAEVRARLDHGDTAGALAAVEALLGPDALLRTGALHDELAAAALGRVDHGLYRAGMSQPRSIPPERKERRARPRHATNPR